MAQWPLVEATFYREYRIEPGEILFEMSWRRFTVLLDHVLSRGSPEDGLSDDGEPDINAMWDRHYGKEPATSIKRMELGEFVSGMS